MSLPPAIKNNPIFVTLGALGSFVGLIHAVPGWAAQIQLWVFMYPAVAIFLAVGILFYILMKLKAHDSNDKEVRTRVTHLENNVENNTNLLVIVAKKLGIDDDTIDAVLGRKDPDASDE